MSPSSARTRARHRNVAASLDGRSRPRARRSSRCASSFASTVRPRPSSASTASALARKATASRNGSPSGRVTRAWRRSSAAPKLPSESVDGACACELDAPKTEVAGYVDVPQVDLHQDSADERQRNASPALPERLRFERVRQRAVVVALSTLEFDEVRERYSTGRVAQRQPALVPLLQRFPRLVEPVDVKQHSAAPRGWTVDQRERLLQRPLEIDRLVQQRERTLRSPVSL